MQVPSNWFIAARLQRLVQALGTVPAQTPGLSSARMAKALWSICGGPADEISDLVSVLRALTLVNDSDESLVRTRLGNHVAKAAASGDLAPFGLLLIRAGFFHDQARLLLEQGVIDPNGDLSCRYRTAASGAPQLLGVLSWWKEVTIRPAVRVPGTLLAELNTVWAMLPPLTVLPPSLARRKAIGDRAEMYTVQFERSRTTNPASIQWVAQDSDTLGWDVEDRTRTPRRCIEVKGRQDSTPSFFVSENQLNKAKEIGPAFEIHFWGNIDLNRPPAVEYAALRSSGYPLAIVDFAAQLRNGAWQLTPVRWRVNQSTPPS